MARTSIDIDEQACSRVMQQYGLSTKQEAINLALRTVADEALDLEAARRMKGSGWEGDLESTRQRRPG